MAEKEIRLELEYLNLISLFIYLFFGSVNDWVLFINCFSLYEMFIWTLEDTCCKRVLHINM